MELGLNGRRFERPVEISHTYTSSRIVVGPGGALCVERTATGFSPGSGSVESVVTEAAAFAQLVESLSARHDSAMNAIRNSR